MHKTKAVDLKLGNLISSNFSYYLFLFCILLLKCYISRDWKYIWLLLAHYDDDLFAHYDDD